MKLVLTTLVGLVFSASALAADEAPAPSTDKEKLSYTLGYRLGMGIKQQGFDVDPAMVNRAINDVLGGGKAALTPAEMQSVAEHYKEQRATEQAELVEKNKQAGDAFLAENKKKKGVTTLPSGIQYEVIEAGKGKSPKPTDQVVANYKGMLIDGKVFDSSYDRGQPSTFALNNVIKGWQEVLPLMKEGAKWHVVIPPDMAYGARGAGNVIGPNSTLVFDIELVEVKQAEQKKAEEKK